MGIGDWGLGIFPLKFRLYNLFKSLYTIISESRYSILFKKGNNSPNFSSLSLFIPNSNIIVKFANKSIHSSVLYI